VLLERGGDKAVERTSQFFKTGVRDTGLDGVKLRPITNSLSAARKNLGQRSQMSILQDGSSGLVPPIDLSLHDAIQSDASRR
jgi:hypothetical protein